MVYRSFFRNVVFLLAMPHSSLLFRTVTHPLGTGTGSSASLQSCELECLKTIVIKCLRVSTCRVEMEHDMVVTFAETKVFLIRISIPPSPSLKCL